MHRLVIALSALLLWSAPVGAWWTPHHRQTIHYFTVWQAHREDVDATGWTAVYSDTHTTCESAAVTTLIMADMGGWPVAAIAPAVLDMERAFPPATPCSITLGLR
jgi:hypothetical protein